MSCREIGDCEAELPKLSRPQISAAVWIGLSVLWLFLGWRKIVRHDEFGWFICGVWAFVAIMWSYRFFVQARKSKS